MEDEASVIPEPQSKPVRVLHVIGSLARGGTETWLMELLRRADRAELSMDFLVHDLPTDGYAEEARKLGANVIYCRRDVLWPIRFLRAVRMNGPYDYVHSHRNNFSAFVLLISLMAGIKGRIAHSHNDVASSAGMLGPMSRLYLNLTRQLVRLVSTRKVAVSEAARNSLFGTTSQGTGGGTRIIYCGIDSAKYGDWKMRDATRDSLGIPTNRLVVGHIGGFREQKNHMFVIEVFKELLKTQPRSTLLLIGVGVQMQAVAKRVDELGLKENVVFLGSRGDVPQLLMAMDVFIFPSLHEGLPLVLMETQASRLPALVADTVSREIDLGENLITWYSLSQSASSWALQLNELQERQAGNRTRLLENATCSSFDIGRSLSDIRSLYGLDESRR